MANMCSNFLFITGGEEVNKKAFIESFKEMKRKADETSLYQFPVEIEVTPENRHYLCDFDITEDQETISFLSRWSCPVELLTDMGKHHKISFKCDYDEGADYYGATFYYHETDSSKNIFLDDEDLEQYQASDDGVYSFRGEIWDSDSEILDILLTEKIEKLCKDM